MKWVLKFKMVTTNELKKNKNKNKRNNKKKTLKISIKDENIVLNTPAFPVSITFSRCANLYQHTDPSHFTSRLFGEWFYSTGPVLY